MLRTIHITADHLWRNAVVSLATVTAALHVKLTIPQIVLNDHVVDGTQNKRQLLGIRRARKVRIDALVQVLVATRKLVEQKGAGGIVR